MFIYLRAVFYLTYFGVFDELVLGHGEGHGELRPDVPYLLLGRP